MFRVLETLYSLIPNSTIVTMYIQNLYKTSLDDFTNSDSG